MCGITGFSSKKLFLENLKEMTDNLTHRGPDAKGYYFKNGIGLGHRRLSILDLSNNGNQPMTSHCGRYKMVYNGEIYNYEEIRNKLNINNWKSSSDSEVILEAFVKWGNEFVKHLNGMFAIAILEMKNNKISLFRDRMGIKPLYYSFKNGEFIFGSELKVFKKINDKLNIDKDSVYSFLHIGYIPSNLTFFKEIKKVSPGSIIELEEGNLKESNYWENEKLVKKSTIKELSKAKKELNELLIDSVCKRLISDVPIGVFLSGGTDSSLISAIAQRYSDKPINTFSIGFQESKFNEIHDAKKVANYLKTNHTEFILTEKDALDQLEKLIYHFDEPIADSSILPTALVSQMAKKHVSVCLSGDGGDELFMGYGSYNWAKRLNNPILWNLRKPISSILSLSKSNREKRAGLVFNSPSKNIKTHIFSQEQYFFSEKEISDLLSNKKSSYIINKINYDPKVNRKLNPSEKQSFFDLNNYLIDNLLVKVDRSSMFSSLEVRVPLLDHRIIDYSLNVNSNLKVNNGVQKYILKEILYDYIPKHIMERPKWGFGFPLSKWLKTDLNYLIKNYLSEEKINQCDILNFDYVKRLINRFYSGEDYLYNRIWALIILSMYLNNFKND